MSPPPYFGDPLGDPIGDLVGERRAVDRARDREHGVDPGSGLGVVDQEVQDVDRALGVADQHQTLAAS